MLDNLNKKYLSKEENSAVETVESTTEHTGVVADLQGIKAAFLVKSKKYSEEVAVKEAAGQAEKASEMLRTKADEVMYSGNTGFGEEIVNDEITISNALDLTSDTKKFAFLDAFAPGRRTVAEISNAKNGKLPILGEPGFMRGRNTYTTGAYPVINPVSSQRVPTDKVDITQEALHYVTAIDYELQCLSVVNMLQKLTRDTGFFLRKTIGSVVINADDNAAATGNVNSDDQLATAGLTDGALDHRFIFDGGLRDVTLNNANASEALGTFSVNDFTDLMSNMDSSVVPQEMVAIMDNGSYYKMLQEVQALQQDNPLSKQVITEGAIANFNGVDIFISPYVPVAKASNGKVDTATPANNDAGSIILVKRNAVQHGFACELETAIHRNSLEQGYVFEAATMFGFGVVTNKAGQGNYVYTGYGVTL